MPPFPGLAGGLFNTISCRASYKINERNQIPLSAWIPQARGTLFKNSARTLPQLFGFPQGSSADTKAQPQHLPCQAQRARCPQQTAQGSFFLQEKLGATLGHIKSPPVFLERPANRVTMPAGAGTAVPRVKSDTKPQNSAQAPPASLK